MMKPPAGRDTIFRYYHIESREIVTFKSLLEGYEGLAVVRTINPEKGVIQLLISPDLLKDVETILAQMPPSMRLAPLSDPGPFLDQSSCDPLSYGDDEC